MLQATIVAARGQRMGWAPAIILALAGLWSGSSRVDAGQVSEARKADDTGPAPLPFRLPPGFVAERAAGPPLVKHPMFASFDECGRLYVADSAGVNPGREELTRNPPHRIRLLEDTDSDGRFDAARDFAPKLTYPQGVLWHNGAIYTAAAPSLWRLEDTDGDGSADRRLQLATGWPLTGIADELHGPDVGPDGRVYWYCGRFHHEIRPPGGPVLRRGRAPLVLRCRADGSEIEVLSGAQGNPVKAAFTDEGEPLVCGTWSGGDGDRQDVIIHSVAGGDYPVLDGDFGEHKKTGELLPPLSKLGVAAACGVVRYRGTAFPEGYRGNLFSALFNMHKVMRHILERDGATFRSRDEDFITSEDPDFHPTDVGEDADGSLLVVDTGSWFSHCPTSKIGTVAAKGGIYRIRRARVDTLADPWGRSIEWARLGARALTRRLDDSRFAVRDRAVALLARRGPEAVAALGEVLRSGAPARVRRNAVWALARIDGPDARAAARSALGDPDMSVRLTAATVVGLHRDALSVRELTERLRNNEAPAVRREAATALGRMRRVDAVPALLDGLRGDVDRFLEHALIYALILIDDRSSALPGLSDPNPRVRRGALIALDQMDHGDLTLEQVRPLLSDPDAALRRTALSAIARRPAWAGSMVETLRSGLEHDESDAAPRTGLREALVAFGRDRAVQDLMGALLGREETPKGTRLLLLEAMARTPLDQLPAAWVAQLRRSLEHRDEQEVRQAVAILRAARTPECDDTLGRLSRDGSRPVDARVDALAALAPRLVRMEPGPFALLRSCLRPDQPPLLRLAAAGALGQAPLAPEQLDELTASIAEAGALELSRLLQAFERSRDGAIGTKLAAALGRSPGLASLTPASVSQTFQSYPAETRRRAEPLLARLQADVPRLAARLAELEPSLARGDAARGHEICFGQKAACTTCHSINSKGGHVGPDLSRIGAIRSGRDLLEAIVFPSASFARGFEPYTIATDDGRVHSGILARESSEVIELVGPDRVVARLPRSSIEEIRRGSASIMPQGLDSQLTRQELADLVVYLRSLR
jgi:putative membrane-bound dehydrogenase-like protein